jgi:hypothetical protein
MTKQNEHGVCFLFHIYFSRCVCFFITYLLLITQKVMHFALQLCTVR